MRRFLVLMMLLATPVQALEIVNTNFNDLSWSTLGHGSFWTMQPTGGVNNSPAPRLEYSVAGTANKALAKTVLSYESNEYWVEFDVKVQGTPSGGSKFVKLFGANGGTENNITLALQYYNNTLYEVSYYGDTVCTARFDGSNGGSCDPGATHVTDTAAIDIRGGEWHHYKAWVKRAYPAGTANGEVKVWLDGVLRGHFTNMDSNPAGRSSTYFFSIELGGYNHTNFNGSVWYLWIDNLYIGTTEKDAHPTVTCEDGEQNGDETGVDCGGSCPTACESAITCWLDFDGDGYGTGVFETVEVCSADHYETLTATTGDCDDYDDLANPGETEICGNAVDEDCDGTAQACPGPSVGLKVGGSGKLKIGGSGKLKR